MPIDDPSPESDENPRPEGVDLDDASTFVDRDDESDTGFVDSDYEEDFPGNPSDLSQTSPDPGYAAFASELDDPLADWPSPDAELEDLPEVRLANNSTTQSDPIPEAEPELGSVTERAKNPELTNIGSSPQVATTDELPEGSELLFPDDSHRASDDSTSGATLTLVDDDDHESWQATDVDTHEDQTDRDDHREIETELVQDAEPVPSPAPPDLTDSDTESADSIDIPPPAMGGIAFGDALAVEQSASVEPTSEETSSDAFAEKAESRPESTDTAFPAPPVPAPTEAEDLSPAVEAPIVENTEDEATEPEIAESANPDTAASGLVDVEQPIDDELVGTGLEVEQEIGTEQDQGLSIIESSQQEDELVDDFLNDLDPPEATKPDPFDIPSAATNTASFMADEETASYDNYDASVEPMQSEAASDDESIWRKIPYGLVAVVVLALALLAVGGFGVIQQRTEMQEEIRRLQSQLATTITPEQAQLERERQRQAEVANESLGAEVEALNAENTELKGQLTELEEKLAERTAQATARAEEQAREAARAEAARLAAVQAAKEQAERERRAAATATAPVQPAIVADGWFVNFGSYAQRDVADRWADRLRVEDGQVMVQTATAAGKTLYRVRVVGLDSQDKAERIATKLEREYQLPRLWVGKN